MSINPYYFVVSHLTWDKNLSAWSGRAFQDGCGCGAGVVKGNRMQSVLFKLVLRQKLERRRVAQRVCTADLPQYTLPA